MIPHDEALDILKRNVRDDDIVLAVYGTAVDWHAIRPNPLNYFSIGAMGLTLLDWPRLDGVLALCAQLHRREFLLTVAPLPIIGGTGSPVNPIATF